MRHQEQVELIPRIEIHQALAAQFSLLAEFLILKVLVKDKDSRALKLVNLNPALQNTDMRKLRMKMSLHPRATIAFFCVKFNLSQ